MSIINNALPGSSIRLLCLIDRVLRRRSGPISRESLVALCHPEGLAGSDGASKRLPDNLRFWLEEQLWKESDEGISTRFPHDSDKQLPIRVLDIAVEQTRKNGLLGSRTEPFCRAISALLAQPNFSLMAQMDVSKEEEMTSQHASAFINNYLPREMRVNQTNAQAKLIEYGQFLGFTEQSPISANTYVMDPTRAIRPRLKALFSEQKSLPVRVFLANLAEQLPMLDGGSFRLEIEKIMADLGWLAGVVENQISASMSHALERLRLDMTLQFDSRSDDPDSMEMMLPGGNRAISTVTLREDTA